MYHSKRYQAHEKEVERIMEILEGQRTDDEKQALSKAALGKDHVSGNSSSGLGLVHYCGIIIVGAVARTVCKRPKSRVMISWQL